MILVPLKLCYSWLNTFFPLVIDWLCNYFFLSWLISCKDVGKIIRFHITSGRLELIRSPTPIISSIYIKKWCPGLWLDYFTPYPWDTLETPWIDCVVDWAWDIWVYVMFQINDSTTWILLSGVDSPWLHIILVILKIWPSTQNIDSWYFIHLFILDKW